MANSYSFRWGLLPYCILRRPDGEYIVCDRQYRELGVVKRRKGQALKRILDKAALNHREDHWFLYDDGTTPDKSEANWTAYHQRLWYLRTLWVVHPEGRNRPDRWPTA